jgi:hypothetical protein
MIRHFNGISKWTSISIDMAMDRVDLSLKYFLDLCEELFNVGDYNGMVRFNTFRTCFHSFAHSFSHSLFIFSSLFLSFSLSLLFSSLLFSSLLFSSLTFSSSLLFLSLLDPLCQMLRICLILNNLCVEFLTAVGAGECSCRGSE